MVIEMILTSPSDHVKWPFNSFFLPRHNYIKRRYIQYGRKILFSFTNLLDVSYFNLSSLSTFQEAEIKKMAKTGNKEACKILAKQLVQVRKQKCRTYAVSSKVTSMSTQTQVMNSQMKMAGAMATTAKVKS